MVTESRVFPLQQPHPLTVAETIDFNLKHNPRQPFYVYSTDPGLPITTISHLEFSRAAHRAANALLPTPGAVEGRLVGIIATLDAVTYQAVTAGLMRAGYIVSEMFVLCSVSLIFNTISSLSSFPLASLRPPLLIY